MTEPLRKRLHHVSQPEAGLLSALGLGQPDLRLAPSQGAAPGWIVLQAEPGNWQAFLAPLSGPQGPLRLTGDAGAPDALRAALALEAIEPLTAALERAWGVALRPVEVSDASNGLALKVEAFDCTALLSIAASDHATIALAVREAPSDRVAGIPVAAAWHVSGPWLGTDRIAALQSGDMLLLAAQAPAELVASGARRTGRVDLAARTMTITETGDLQMPVIEEGWAAARTPVQIVIDGGAVPVGQLAALTPGGVLTLDVTGDVLPVEVRAGGARIGRGELVAVGDAFGVVLSEVDLPAAPQPEQAPTAAEPVDA